MNDSGFFAAFSAAYTDPSHANPATRILQAAAEKAAAEKAAAEKVEAEIWEKVAARAILARAARGAAAAAPLLLAPAFVYAPIFDGHRPGYAFKSGSQNPQGYYLAQGYYLERGAGATAAEPAFLQQLQQKVVASAAPAFVYAPIFDGHRPGYAFKSGSQGMGYYLERGAGATAAEPAFLQQLQQTFRARRPHRRPDGDLDDEDEDDEDDAASKAPQPPAQPPQTASVEVHVQSMDVRALVEALETLGVSASTTKDNQLRERLLELVKPDGPDPAGWEEALVAARRRGLLRFLADCGRTESDAKRVADAQLEGRGSTAEYQAMWDGLVAQYCPSAPAPPDRSSSGKVLVIAPGFSFMANSAQILVLERAFGAAVIRSTQHANPEEPGFDMSEGIKHILREIRKHKPKAVLCASKGGLYMAELWRLMAAGGHDHLKGIGYLMINARPTLTRLPSGVKVIVVQGAKEEKWPRSRGYNAAGKVEDGSLEALIRTGSPGLCYLYYTADVKSGLGDRNGDKHVPASLLQYDCLPRLVDALLSPSPSSAFQASSRAFLSTERMAAENGLGWHPNTLRSRFVGDGLRVEVPRGSDEFKNVEAIFKADPAKGVKRFYFQRDDHGTNHLDITKVERVQNPELKDSVDDKRGRFKKMLESFGEQYEAGVHSRWLFHGAGSTDALENIIENPMTGFAPQMGLGNGGTNLWGYGSYFARDASYSVHAGYCNDCRDEDQNRMALLCLVECGLSCVGEGHMRIMPKTHPERRQLPYMSYVDYASNPEIFVTMGEQAYPAYIIHFDD
jgi:hypothetical protein